MIRPGRPISPASTGFKTGGAQRMPAPGPALIDGNVVRGDMAKDAAVDQRESGSLTV
jgi:hypothetical protein